MRYRNTHQPTSYITAVVPGVRKNWYGSLQGWPRSTMRPTTTKRYPRKPVRIAGLSTGRNCFWPNR